MACFSFQNFTDAEKAFSQVLKLDKNCHDAVSELFYVRVHQLMVCLLRDLLQRFILLFSEICHLI